MRKLAVLTFLTLDGVMQAPGDPAEDRSEGFMHGGWARECWDEVMQQVLQEAMAEPYELLLGRKTYDIFAASFSKSSDSDPVTRKLNQATKFVVTSNPKALQWENSKRINGDIAAEVSRLKKQDGPLLQIHGSWELIQLLHSQELIDEYRLWTFPVVVGAGKRLFDQGVTPTNLSLTKTERCPSGAVMTIYEQSTKNAIQIVQVRSASKLAPPDT